MQRRNEKKLPNLVIKLKIFGWLQNTAYHPFTSMLSVIFLKICINFFAKKSITDVLYVLSYTSVSFKFSWLISELWTKIHEVSVKVKAIKTHPRNYRRNTLT